MMEPPYDLELYVLNRCTETLYSNVTADDRVPFTTLSSSEGIYDVESGTLTLYPNPASEKVTMTVTGFDGAVEQAVPDIILHFMSVSDDASGMCFSSKDMH